MALGVTNYTNQISNYENAASAGTMKFYKLDEEEYDKICQELEKNR